MTILTIALLIILLTLVVSLADDVLEYIKERKSNA